MVNQTLISFKCDTTQLSILDETCSRLGVKRNHLLNFLVSYSNVMFRDVEKLRLLVAYASALDEIPPMKFEYKNGYIHDVDD